ncbi:peptidoglycan D,D-transpeptidase FtsI family protein [Priestia megaterium]|jgi:cell division protein FtsI/penicillin-binding protein 2|uniref:peptidoglycan D,D-transpeptidase FtsI family protein n=3 Tax=Priestia megaterium TaxID=1404 RepID=UPI000BEE0C12|nr:penicillin-binding protein 2 [Priestia megaterium]MDH6656883.1 cell division protein FtsI/penicillin-binding protein 2 [Bacillus sp. PvP124]MDP9579689.1 cell division protein FtsI/penicillin-binding protein 2 [Bacillus sp. 1751]MBV6738210.1 penicillin-binding protein 2 [Priestia megaterium]MDH3178085.1 penicillin-binding protein 2 [Priestia megaterium]MED4068115.1 penicillin-binding protein 2 [Priestia megaterium]
MKRKREKYQIPYRVNLIFLVVFVLFSVLILRLGLIQIVYGENYSRKVEKAQNATVSTPVPRGKMYDRYNRVIVDNTPLNTITYTRFQGNTTEERLRIAKKLATMLDIPYTTNVIDIPGNKKNVDAKNVVKITERDMKDYWITIHPEKAEHKITKTDRKKVQDGRMTDAELYKRQLERISKKDLESLKDDLEILAIKRQMEGGYSNTPQIVKSNVTNEQYAVISEHLDELPGVDTTTYWERSYPENSTLRTLLGNVSSANEGLPKEKIQYYLSRGYSRNDQVGTSYLEKQYEAQLRGQKEKVRYVTDKKGSLLNTIQVSQGERGSDLVLTIDMKLQKSVEEQITDQLLAKKQMNGTEFLDRAFVIMMDPHTGEILTMAGKKYTIDKKTGTPKIEDFSLGNISTSYEMGSVIKGATVLAGLDSGAITPNTILVDNPIKIKGTPIKKSAEAVGLGPLNYSSALKYSSNVFMFKTVMAMAGLQYQPNMTLPIKADTFTKLRFYYNQFGLGVSTGIDLDNESIGLQGGNTIAGTALDLGIGQYDTYTPLQIVQYISTIANGGYRIKPQIVKEIRKPTIKTDEIGGTQYSFEPDVLNHITMKEEYIKDIQNAFKRVTQEKGGTGYVAFNTAKYNPAGKSGTAQAYQKNSKGGDPIEVNNSTFVAYAPADKPQIAVAVAVPSAFLPNTPNTIAKELARSALDTYFDLKKKGEQEVINQEEKQKEVIANQVD